MNQNHSGGHDLKKNEGKEDIKIPALGKKQRGIQEKREVNIFPQLPLSPAINPAARAADSQNGREKGEEMKRVNKEISIAFKNPLKPNGCQDHNAF